MKTITLPAITVTLNHCNLDTYRDAMVLEAKRLASADFLRRDDLFEAALGDLMETIALYRAAELEHGAKAGRYDRGQVATA